MTLRLVCTAFLAAATTCAAAGDLERAIRILDEQEPKSCALRTLQTQTHRAKSGTPERELLERRFYDTAMEIERGNRDAKAEFDAIFDKLPRSDREKLLHHAMALAEKCLAPLGPDPEPELPAYTAPPPVVKPTPAPQSAPSNPGSTGERGYTR